MWITCERFGRPNLREPFPSGRRLTLPLPRPHTSGSNKEGRRGAAPLTNAPAVSGLRTRMTVLVSAQGLTKAYGPRPLFSDLSIDLRAGERVGLIGPNGAGKSTLLRLLAGIEQPDAGERAQRRGARVGYLAQDDRFAAGLSAR